jgi:8-oxo-dGTP pyrophosphatase MutT (NUDIX family)
MTRMSLARRVVQQGGEPKSLARILDAFDAPEPERVGELPADLAAVLLALYETPDGPALLYTRRTDTMRSHAGQISFPGGRVERGESPRDAALRESAEEVGLHDVTDARHLTDYLTFRGTTIIAYVARAHGAPPTVPASRDEVAEVFLVPVDALLDPSTYEARAIEGMRLVAPERRVHYWRIGGRIVWGITGELTARFLTRAFGWQPPADVREIERVEDFDPRTLP